MIAWAVAGIDWRLLVVAALVVMIGAAVQATVGIGLGMLAAPVLGLIDEAFLPTVIIIVVIPLSAAVAWRERHGVAWDDVGVAFIGRIPGVTLGALMLSVISARALQLIVAALVLAAVYATSGRLRFRTTRRNLLIAGTASGLFGTAAGVGGPPIALTYQRSDPAVLRPTLAAFFTIGSVMSLTALGVAGEIDRHRLALGALMLPAVITGLVLSGPVIARLPQRAVRTGILVLCTVSAIALGIRGIIG